VVVDLVMDWVIGLYRIILVTTSNRAVINMMTVMDVKGRKPGNHNETVTCNSVNV